MGVPINPVTMFLWASIWMLREIEVRNMKVGDVKLNPDGRNVTILLTLSKCDQQGMGVRRTLKCHCPSTCCHWCPWKLGQELIAGAKLKGYFADSPLFTDHRGCAVSKAGVVKKWKNIFGQSITGHSPKRSGAMFFVRSGLPIQELAVLGRWRSSVVLQYAEEALQEKAVSIPMFENQNMGKILRLPQHETKEIPESQVDKPMKDHSENQFEDIAQAFANPHDLWVVTKGRGWRGRPRP